MNFVSSEIRSPNRIPVVAGPHEISSRCCEGSPPKPAHQKCNQTMLNLCHIKPMPFTCDVCLTVKDPENQRTPNSSWLLGMSY